MRTWSGPYGHTLTSGFPRPFKTAFSDCPNVSRCRALLLEAGVAARTDRELRDSLKPTLTALIDRWIEDYRSWQQFGKVDRRIEMADLVTLLWSIELGLGVLEAQSSVRSTPASLADFVGTTLASLEEQPGQPLEQGRRKARPSGRASRRETSASALRKRAERASQASGGSAASTTQQKLVDAAMELFAEEGYAAVSVRDIARASGFTTGSLYGNFANKADVLVEAIDALLARDLEMLPADLLRSGAPWEMIEFYLRDFSRRARLRALVLEGAAAARSETDVHDRLRDIELRHQDSWIDGLATWLDTYGIVPLFEPRTLVTSLWSAELGLGLLEALDLYIPAPAALAALFAVFLGVAGLEPPSSHQPRGSVVKQTRR